MPIVTTTRTSASVKHAVSLEFDGVGVDYESIQNEQISLVENEHDLLTVVLTGISSLSITDYLDVPVRATVEVPYGNGFKFCGYVSHINPVHKSQSGKVNGSLFQQAEIVCLGASAVMRGKRNRVWESFRVKDMVDRFSQIYNLSYSCPDDSVVIPRMIQQGQSDWEILVRACRQSGLAVNVHGTEIHVWDPVNAIRYGAPSASLSSVSLSDAVNAPGKIMDFGGTFGSSHNLNGQGNNESIELLDDSGALLTASSSDLLGSSSSYGTEVVSSVHDVLPIEATSMAEARRRLAASKAATDSFTIHPTTTGVAGPIPGSNVSVRGLDSDFDGYWLVRELCMKFNKGHFITSFGLGRNSTGDLYTGQTQLDSYDDPPPSKLHLGKWVSTTRRGHAYRTV